MKYSNFLWKLINNKFLYQTRKRIIDFKNIFIKNGFDIIEIKRCDVTCNKIDDYYFKNNFYSKLKVSKNEKIESIELLRAIENNMKLGSNKIKSGLKMRLLKSKSYNH